MIRSWIRITLILLVLNILLVDCGSFARGGSRGSRGKPPRENKGYGTNTGGTSQGQLTPHSTRRGLGLSGWGIVILTVFLIMAGMGLYYAVTCYPIICRKQSSYNMMGLTPV